MQRVRDNSFERSTGEPWSSQTYRIKFPPICYPLVYRVSAFYLDVSAAETRSWIHGRIHGRAIFHLNFHVTLHLRFLTNILATITTFLQSSLTDNRYFKRIVQYKSSFNRIRQKIGYLSDEGSIKVTKRNDR